jgi:hypothetical protein
LNGASQVPPVFTNGVGSVRLTLDQSGNTVLGGWGLGNLSSAITAVEVRQAAAGANGDVVLTFASVPTSGGSFTTFTNASPSLLAGMHDDPTAYYVNVKTTNAPQGEVRGQFGCPTTTATMVGTSLSGASEVPANDSAGTGTVQLTLDPDNGTVVGSWQVSGLGAAITAAHIHQAAFGVNGADVVTFSGLPAGGGSFTTVTTGVSPSLITSILAQPRPF